MKETRLSRGRAGSEARFTAASSKADLPADYAALLDDLKKRIAGGRLRETFPDMKGLSPRNLKHMRAFAEAWPDRTIVQQLAAQLPWFNAKMEQGWSRSIPAMQIESGLHEREVETVKSLTRNHRQGGIVFQDVYVL